MKTRRIEITAFRHERTIISGDQAKPDAEGNPAQISSIEFDGPVIDAPLSCEPPTPFDQLVCSPELLRAIQPLMNNDDSSKPARQRPGRRRNKFRAKLRSLVFRRKADD